MASIYQNLLDQAETLITALGLTLAGDPFTVDVRKLPTAAETLDTLPVIFVVPDEMPGDQTWWTDTEVKRTHKFQVAFIMQGNRDPVSNLTEINSNRQEVIRLFTDPDSLDAPEDGKIFDTKVDPAVVIDRNLYSQNYDYSLIGVAISVIEPPA